MKSYQLYNYINNLAGEIPDFFINKITEGKR